MKVGRAVPQPAVGIQRPGAVEDTASYLLRFDLILWLGLGRVCVGSFGLFGDRRTFTKHLRDFLDRAGNVALPGRIHIRLAGQQVRQTLDLLF